ncbi:MAG: hypothetical protein CVV44_14510 [Spirochaetae bacterium HGW-Spirochaetae-1]|jgi:hypothetical protein|nr:MAG: hypothetical protein CVV44_14510 [Spirochaetae bacterium HGW-Spirochaetae-1]
MKQAKRNNRDFREMLQKYLDIKGLDIIVVLDDGSEVELYKNRSLIDDMLVSLEKGKGEMRIPLSQIKSVDLFAA